MAYIANKKTGVVHDAGKRGDACRVSEILKKNRVTFKTVADALAYSKRLRKCLICCQ